MQTSVTTPAPQPSGASAQRSRFPLLFPGTALAEGAFIVAAMWVFLHGWRRDFKVPFGFTIDSLFYLMQAKSTVDNGWWWFNPMVGAPLGLDELAFPANGNVDQGLVWLVSWLVADPLAAVNLTWLLMLAISGVAATWCLRTLGRSTPVAIVVGTLFALTPYALYKNIAHFGMAIYLVPFVCTIGLQLASGRLPERGYLKGPGLGLLVGSGLIGFNYIYYPFFACFFIALATAIGFFSFRTRRILAAGTFVLTVIAGCTAANLAPSLYSWHRQGRPIIFIDKVPSQAEIYGLKIRTLVSPTIHHWFPPFRKWIEKEQMSQYPLETENVTSRLGLVGTIGFMGLLGLLLAPAVAARSDGGRLCLAASQLVVAGLLLATTGGLGAVFNLLVTPDIRAYARICPFLAMFALIGIATAIDAVPSHSRWRLLLTAGVLAIGLADQSTAAAGMNNEYPTIAAELPGLKGFVQQMEQSLPENAMVLQLPFRRTFLNEIGAVRMRPYEHLKLYLVSRHLRWSYPALTNDQAGWEEAAARLTPAQLPMQMSVEGFSAIVIDRYGYEDNGQSVATAVQDVLGEGSVLAETERYVAFDLRTLAGRAALPRLPVHPEPMSVGMRPCTGQTPMTVERAGRARLPFPAGVATVNGSHPIKITGWGIDRPGASTGAAMDVVVDGTPHSTFYGLDREDVSNYFGRVSYRQSGFSAELPSHSLSPGAHTLALRVIAADRQCYYEGPAVPLVVG